MAEKWFLANKGKGFGPFSPAQLKQMVEAGLADHDDLVWRDGDSESIPASAIGTQPPPLPTTQASKSFPPTGNVADRPRRSSRFAWLAVAFAALCMIGGAAWLVYNRGWLLAEIKTIPSDTSVANNSTAGDFPEGESDQPVSQSSPIRNQPDVPESKPTTTNRESGAKSAESPPTAADLGFPTPMFSLTFDDDHLPSHQLTANGARIVNGVRGKAVEFSGKSFIQVPCTLPAGRSPRTLAAWIKNKGKSELRNSHAIAYGKDIEGKRAWGIYHQLDQWGMYGWGNQIPSTSVVDTEWHHHCVTSDGMSLVYWIDGRIVANSNHPLNTTDGPLVLGTDATAGTYFCFTGLIDELAVYDVALSGRQVEQLAKEGPR